MHVHPAAGRLHLMLTANTSEFQAVVVSDTPPRLDSCLDHPPEAVLF